VELFNISWELKPADPPRRNDFKAGRNNPKAGRNNFKAGGASFKIQRNKIQMRLSMNSKS
jgi:hypothetical protein